MGIYLFSKITGKMVLYFTSINPEYTLYMGKDKYENESLIKYGFPEDVWFHVSKLSSAHVYVRLKRGETYKDIPQDVLTDCAQLVKANSIQGNKRKNLEICYTPWSNLKKTRGMEVGQVGFHNDNMVKYIRVEARVNEIVNRLNKTKVEKFPDLQEEKQLRDLELKEERKIQMAIDDQRRKEEEEQKKINAELKSYSSIMVEENMTTREEMSKMTVEEYEDDFM